MRSKTIAIAGSIAALSLAAAPAAAFAANGNQGPQPAASVDHSRDLRGVKHVDKTRDLHSADKSRDVRDR